MMSNSLGIVAQLTYLTGVELPEPFVKSNLCTHAESLLRSTGLGYSQFNELLLSASSNRVSEWFFQFLIDGTADYQRNNALKTIPCFVEGVSRFRRLAMLRFGNIRHAFDYLRTRDQEELKSILSILDPIHESDFQRRHEPLHPIKKIPGEDTYYLGYLIKRNIDDRLAKNPQDTQAKHDLDRRAELVQVAIDNHKAYLASDHMDVYVATSMRERHEYNFVHSVSQKIFADSSLKNMKLRWFDPTQAYCNDRIDKGIAEALMLKRAKCTIYFAQESDTLGKDSELAATLAQGKVVIAFVPDPASSGQDKYLAWLLNDLRKLNRGLTDRQLIIQQLQVFDPTLAWINSDFRKNIDDSRKFSETKLKSMLAASIAAHYNKRAKLLAEDHPLGIQVNLDTGVANGVLVTRTTSECAKLIKKVITNTLEFSLEDKAIEGKRYTFLRETITKCIFRVISGDQELTNSFWNYYLS